MLLQYGPHFFSTLSEKFGQLARFFWANGLLPPLAKNFPYAYGQAVMKMTRTVGVPVLKDHLALQIHGSKLTLILRRVGGHSHKQTM